MKIVKSHPSKAINLIRDLDRYLNALYPAEGNHLMDANSLARSDVEFYVLYEDIEPIGCGAVKMPGNGTAEIKRMYIRPGSRGKGYARALLMKLKEEAKNAGTRRLVLETGIKQFEAIRLYEMFGFSKCQPFGDYQDDGISLFYEMEL